jgi:hypothetical protein
MDGIKELIDQGVVQPYGSRTGKCLDFGELVGTIKKYNNRRADIVAPRSAFFPVTVRTVEGATTPRLGFSIVNDPDTYYPTNTALSQVSEKTRIPLEFLRANIAKYPSIAADMLSAWWLDDDLANHEGTTKARKAKVEAKSVRQLFRLFKPEGDSSGVLRAVLSSKYLIINNMDVAGVVLEEIEKAGVKPEAHGALTDEKMHVRFKMHDIGATIEFPGKGRGHEHVRIPCGASLLMSNSDVGMGRCVLAQELEIISCTNMARSTESLQQIHIGRELDDLGLLSQETIQKQCSATLSRLRDVTRASLSEEGFKRLAARLSAQAGMPVDNAALAIENVTNKYSLGEDTGRHILDRYVEEGLANRFGLFQAITFQAHAVREDNFEDSLYLEDVGSKILAMPEPDFRSQFTQEN